MLWVKCKTWLITSPVCGRELCVLSFYNMILWNLTAVGSLITCSITLITYQNMWIFQKCDNVSWTAGDIKENITHANTLISFCHAESSSASWLRFMEFLVNLFYCMLQDMLYTLFLHSTSCYRKNAWRNMLWDSRVRSCLAVFVYRDIFSRKVPRKKKIIWNVFHSMSHTRLQQINKPCCLAAETQRNVTHQSSDDGNGTTGMLNFTGRCVGTAGVALDPFKAFLYVCYQLCV